MTSKLLFAIICSILCFFSCKKSEPELTFPYNFSCKIDGRSYSTDYDSAFVTLSTLYTDYDKQSKKLIIESYNILRGNFYIVIDGFEKEGFIYNTSIFAKLQTEELLGPSKYDYEIDYSHQSKFHIIEYDRLRNTVKGTFSLALKPIDMHSNLHPIDITDGKFRFEFD